MPLSARFTFLQVSDVHLDSKLSGKRLPFSGQQARRWNQEILSGFLKAMQVARERRVDAVLVVGDLWDSHTVSAWTINRLVECFEELGDIPVVVAPGNHDYAGGDSPWDPRVLRSRGIRPWSSNVHVFRSPEFQIFRHPTREDISFTGRAFTGNVTVHERLLAGEVPTDLSCAVNILVFHGSLDGYKGEDACLPGKITAPFSGAELESLGFTYAAIGHYHDYTEILSESGNLIGAYCGCLMGRAADEIGRKYVILGSIGPDQGQVTLEKVDLNLPRIVSARCDVTGLTSSALVEKVSGLMADCRPKTDAGLLELVGRHATGLEPAAALAELKEGYNHLVLEDHSRPDYLIEKRDGRTVEGKFIEAMLQLKAEAQQLGTVTVPGGNDSVSEEVIEDALYYGLDALKQKKVSVRYVD